MPPVVMERKIKPMQNKRAQTTLELSLLIIIIVAALLSMSIYLKRAMQGKLRAVADDVGEQYSPTNMNSDTTSSTDSFITKDIVYYNSGEGPFDSKVTYQIDTDETNARQGYEEMQNDNSEDLF